MFLFSLVLSFKWCPLKRTEEVALDCSPLRPRRPFLGLSLPPLRIYSTMEFTQTKEIIPTCSSLPLERLPEPMEELEATLTWKFSIRPTTRCHQDVRPESSRSCCKTSVLCSAVIDKPDYSFTSVSTVATSTIWKTEVSLHLVWFTLYNLALCNIDTLGYNTLVFHMLNWNFIYSC